MLEAWWNKFYNACVRSIDPTLKAGIILLIGVLALGCFVYATYGKVTDLKTGKEIRSKDYIKRPFFFVLFIFLVIIDIVYAAL